MKKIDKKAYLYALVIGVVLIIIGLAFPVPGGALTTYSDLDGSSADDYYAFSNKYSSIDEHVGGDAYNYIIGACLVAGKTAGAMATKAIFIVGGAMCICFGLTIMTMQKKEKADVADCNDEVEVSDSTIEMAEQKKTETVDETAIEAM